MDDFKSQPFITVVTCTGERPELFALCQRWVESQRFRPDLWIVAVDAGDIPSGLPRYATTIRIPKVPDDFRAANRPSPATWALYYTLGAVPAGHHVAIMEDDDWYTPWHTSRCLNGTLRGSIVHGDTAVRFHLPTARWTGFTSCREPIEGMVGVRSDAVAAYRESLLSGKRMTDTYRYIGFSTVGIKGVGYGLPGRAGATSKHRGDHKKTLRMLRDDGYVMFRDILGEDDANAYLSLLCRE